MILLSTAQNVSSFSTLVVVSENCDKDRFTGIYGKPVMQFVDHMKTPTYSHKILVGDVRERGAEVVCREYEPTMNI